MWIQGAGAELDRPSRRGGWSTPGYPANALASSLIRVQGSGWG
jgi:hypothetical protein